MSILIKGMEMPTTYPQTVTIYPDGQVLSETAGEKHNHSIAAPVQQHGRLIDADALIAWFDEWYDVDLEIGNIIYILEDKSVTPTILEAEGE